MSIDDLGVVLMADPLNEYRPLRGEQLHRQEMRDGG
jgi:hypothetical protein